MTAVAHPQPFLMPWAMGGTNDSTFRRWLGVCLVAVLVAGIGVPLVNLPEEEKEVVEEPPIELSQILLDKPEIVIPPPPPQPKVEAEPEPVKPKEKPKEIAPTPEPKVADVKEKAKEAGLLQFKDAFADMRETVDITRLQDTAAIQRGTSDAATIDRSLLTSTRSTRSAGVNVTRLSRDVGGVALSGQETSKVAATPGAVGGGGVRLSNHSRGDASGNGKAGDPRSRSIEDIRRVFDQNKGAIFAIYNRALRSDPTLQGKVVLELVINPAGEVMNCNVVASELADAALVQRIVSRVRMFNFGSKDVRTTTISYPVHFLPT